MKCIRCGYEHGLLYTEFSLGKTPMPLCIACALDLEKFLSGTALAEGVRINRRYEECPKE